MIFVYSVTLVLLGLLGAENFVVSKLPAMRTFMDSLKKYQEIVGFAGIVFGVIYGAQWIDDIGTIRTNPAHFFILLFSVIMSFGLGLVFGLEVIRRNLKDTSSPIFLKLDAFRQLSVRFQNGFGISSIVLGVLNYLERF